jgi:hypothetical protein
VKPTLCIFVALLFLVAALICLSQEVAAKPSGQLDTIAGGVAVPPAPEVGVISRTPERLARGKYLVEGLLQCTLCHSETDFSKRPVEPRPGTRGGGRVFDRTLAFGPGSRVVASNLTSDPQYGAANWNDSDFVRALTRHRARWANLVPDDALQIFSQSLG